MRALPLSALAPRAVQWHGVISRATRRRLPAGSLGCGVATGRLGRSLGHVRVVRAAPSRLGFAGASFHGRPLGCSRDERLSCFVLRLRAASAAEPTVVLHYPTRFSRAGALAAQAGDSYDPYNTGALRGALAAGSGDAGADMSSHYGASAHPEVLEARQEVAVMEAAAAVLEEKLAAGALETAAAREAQARAEEKAVALAQEAQWLQARLVSLQAEGDGDAAEAHEAVRKLRKELTILKAERDTAQAAVKGQLQELRVGASAVGAKIALTEQLEHLKASIAPLQAALEAERAWSKEMEAQLEGEKTAKLALAAKSSAMVKALRQQVDDAKSAAVSARSTPAPSVAASDGEGGHAYGSEADAKAAMEERKALAREVSFLKERVKATQDNLDKERAAARERELRLKGRYDAMLEKSLAEADAGAAAALASQVMDLQAALEGAFEREAELKAQLGARG